MIRGIRMWLEKEAENKDKVEIDGSVPHHINRGKDS